MTYLLKRGQNCIYILCILCITHTAFAQEEFVIPDSLKGKSFDYLFDHARSNYTDTTLSLIYLNTSFKKAIRENRKANQSYTLALLSYYEGDKNRKLDLIKKSIEKSKNIDSIHSIFPYYALGQYYYNNFEYEKALHEYIRVLNISKKKGSKYYESVSENQIANLKATVGQHQKAIVLYKKSLRNKYDKNASDLASITQTLVNLAESMRYLKKHDSASYYYNFIIEKGYKKNSYYIDKATINQGINLYEIGDFKKSELLLKKGANEIDLNDTSNLKYYILSQFYLGKINQITHNDTYKARSYFLKVDSLFTTSSIVIPETRGAYEFLIAEYKKQGDFNAQLKTINKLLQFDSIISSRKIRTANKLYSEYDTPKLLENKELIIKELENRTSILNTRASYLSITILFLIILFGIQYRRHKKYKNRFNVIISELDNYETKKVVHSNITSSPQLLDAVDEDTITTVLKKLDLFEKKRGFLQKDITLAILAKKCGTNTKYLPKIIHTYKNRSFVNYINNLRIDYILKELKENTTLQKYTIKTVSEEAGFNTAESFARAFKNKTGIRPSYYIRNLKKR